MRTLLIAIAILFFTGSSGQTPTSLTFEEANEAYSKADYKTAITKYESILEQEETSASLYYNLGNSYYKDNQLGKAILNFERSLLLNPKDEQALFNLALARRKVKGEIDPVPPFFLLAWWRSWRGLMSSTTWGVIGLLLFWAGIASLCVWQLGKSPDQKKKGFFGGLVLLLISVVPLTLAWSAFSHQNDTNEAIITVDAASLKSGADENSTEIRSVYEGTKLFLLDQISIWYKVRLENGEIGWLSGNSFEEI